MMADSADWHPETIAQHLGEDNYVLGAVVPPIFQNSTFVFDTWDEFMQASEYKPGPPYHYSRMSNPNCEVAEAKIAALEGTDRCKLYVSGMAAISTAILSSVKAGSHIVCVDSVYGPTRQLISDWLPRFGVTSTFVVGEDPQEIFDACRPETSLIYLESPTSIIYRLQDLAAVGVFARERGITTAIDNSYASPVYQNPATFGIDLVLHTGSKYLGGHSDLIAGALCCNESRMESLIKNELGILGNSLAPFQAWLVTRSLRTLHIKIKAVEEAARYVADWLRGHPLVDKIFYVGGEDFPQRDLRDRQMGGTTGLVTFMPKFQDRDAVRRMTEATRLYRMGVSWGGHESLIVPLEFHPMDWPEKKWLIRLYCALENPEDLVKDLEQAFAKA